MYRTACTAAVWLTRVRYPLPEILLIFLERTHGKCSPHFVHNSMTAWYSANVLRCRKAQDKCLSLLRSRAGVLLLGSNSIDLHCRKSKFRRAKLWNVTQACWDPSLCQAHIHPSKHATLVDCSQKWQMSPIPCRLTKVRSIPVPCEHKIRAGGEGRRYAWFRFMASCTIDTHVFETSYMHQPWDIACWTAIWSNDGQLLGVQSTVLQLVGHAASRVVNQRLIAVMPSMIWLVSPTSYSLAFSIWSMCGISHNQDWRVNAWPPREARLISFVGLVTNRIENMHKAMWH